MSPGKGGRDQRPVFFFHLPKTGGASVVAAARAVLGNSAIGLYDPAIERAPSARFTARVRKIASGDEVRFLHAHAAPASLAEDAGVRRAVTLREPLDRLVSHFCYCYEHRHFDRDQFAFFQQGHYRNRGSFEAAHVAEWSHHFRIDNYMTRYLTGEMENPLIEGLQQRAVVLLQEMHLIGFTDQLKQFFGTMGVAVTGIPFPEMHANVSDRSKVELSRRDTQDLVDTFLGHDIFVFEQARAIASRLPPVAAPPEWLTIPVVANRNLVSRLRHRTWAEVVGAAKSRLIPGWRRLRERLGMTRKSSLKGAGSAQTDV